jgi:hypothetical protein
LTVWAVGRILSSSFSQRARFRDSLQHRVWEGFQNHLSGCG